MITSRSVRFLVNGAVATAVNYAVLALLVEQAGMRYTGAAALLSALAGIAASFVGNRHFVFRSKAPILQELVRFKAVYAGIALFQAACLAVWSDMLALDYTLGFLLVTAVSVLLSYCGNRSFVFK